MDITIRKARNEDAEKIADIKISGWQNSYKGIIEDEFLLKMDRDIEIEKKYKNIANNEIIVAEINNEIVAFSIYRDYIKNKDENFDADCEISSLYVRTDLKRQGIGKQMMEYILNDLKNKRKKKMILGCLKDNYPSRAFYEKMGGKFAKYDKAQFGDKKYELVIYEYEL